MEEKSVIKRILIAVIVVLIGAVCIAGFLALKHSHGGSWDVLLVFGIKCTSMSSFWRFMIIYFIIFELLIWVSAYLAAGVVGCFGDTSIGATISVIIAIVGVIALAGVVSWICGQSGGKNYYNAMGQNIVCDFVIAASIFSDDD